MKNLIKTALSTAAIAILPVLSSAEVDKSIYGNDDRKDYFQMSPQMKAVADSVVSLWKAGAIQTTNPGEVKFNTIKFADALNLCPYERFREQPIGAFCSGSLVGEDLVMTAGHCITKEADCAGTKIVFGFSVNKEGGEATTSMSASEVYGCSKIVKRFLSGEPGSPNPAGQAVGADFALIKLDRKVTGHKPLSINRASGLKKGDAVFVIGHPVGLPLKLAGYANVRDFSKVDYFVTDLDTFGGNSGSPVFNVKTKKIEGILVRGDVDFISSPLAGCTTMATYTQNGGQGEDVTKISALSAYIPKLPGEKDYKRPAPEGTVGVNMSGIQAGLEIPSQMVSFD